MAALQKEHKYEFTKGQNYSQYSGKFHPNTGTGNTCLGCGINSFTHQKLGCDVNSS